MSNNYSEQELSEAKERYLTIFKSYRDVNDEIGRVQNKMTVMVKSDNYNKYSPGKDMEELDRQLANLRKNAKVIETQIDEQKASDPIFALVSKTTYLNEGGGGKKSRKSRRKRPSSRRNKPNKKRGSTRRRR
jgi:phage-related tail protein